MTHMRPRPSFPALIRCLLWALVAFVGVAYIAIYATRPLFQDDLAYFAGNARWIATHSPALLRLPTHIIGTWLDINGRLGDSLNIFWFNFLPEPLSLLLLGGTVSALYAFFILWVRRLCPGVPAAVIAATALMFGLPWWDSGLLRVINYNYVLASVLMLFWLGRVLLRPIGGRSLWLWVVLGFLAGGWHEASGVPVACSLAAALLARRIFGPEACILLPARGNRIAALGLFAGALYALSSPSLWSRVAGSSVRESGFAEVLLTSDWALLLLLLLLALRGLRLLLRHESLRSLLRSSRAQLVAFFCLAAFGSGALSIYSGIVGRTGMFAQIFAFLACFGLAAPALPRFSRRARAFGYCLSLVLIILMALHTALFLRRQLTLNREAARVVEAFLARPDQPVYYDIPSVFDEPWWLFGKAAGIFPGYDAWGERVLREVSGGGRHTLVVFPEAWRGIPLDSLPVVEVAPSRVSRRLLVRNDSLFFLALPPGATSPADSLRRIPVPTALRPGDRITTVNRSPDLLN